MPAVGRAAPGGGAAGGRVLEVASVRGCGGRFFGLPRGKARRKRSGRGLVVEQAQQQASAEWGV